MAKGKLVRVCVLYIVAAATVGGSFTQALFIVLWLWVNTRSSLYKRPILGKNVIKVASSGRLPLSVTKA